jgi:peptidoglycan/LPS O-acetylase OafA/YrhL
MESPLPSSPRFPHFDGLRAIAALTVVGIHTALATSYVSGWHGAFVQQLAFGVPVFFVISGFLLYRPFVAARVEGRSVSARGFARRRLLRIVPGYWFALTILALWPGLRHMSLHNAWVYYGFAQDFGHRSLFAGLTPAWSLGTEMCFYALLPVYAFVLARRPVRAAGAALALEVSVLGALAAAALLFRVELPRDRHYLGYTLAGTFDWFALGMGLAALSVYSTRSVRAGRLASRLRACGPAFWVAALGFLVLGTLESKLRPYPQGVEKALALHLLRGAAAVCLVLPAAFPPVRAAFPHRVLATPVLARLGVISYGIYLWHDPLVPELRDHFHQYVGIAPTGLFGTLALLFAVVVVTVVCATFSYVVIERPALRLKEPRSRRPDADAVADMRPAASLAP